MANQIVTFSDGTNTIYPRRAHVNLTSSDDLNNYRDTLCAWVNNSANLPSGVPSTFGWLLVDGNGINCLQRLYVHGGQGIPRIYIRHFANSQWYAWRYITTTAI